MSAACILLAAKISSDLKKQEVKHLIDVSHTHAHTQSRTMVMTSACQSDHVAWFCDLPEQVENNLQGLRAVSVLHSQLMTLLTHSVCVLPQRALTHLFLL